MKKTQGFGAMLKLGLVLALYAVAACVSLALVYTATKKTIEEQADRDLQNSLYEMFPEADSFKKLSEAGEIDPEKEIKGTIPSPNPAKVSFGAGNAAYAGGRVIGVAIEASAKSYGGPIKILVGVRADGTIARIKILDHSDTPGLGAKAVKEKFHGQFREKSVGDAFEPKKDVAAITAATVTSMAVSLAVKAAGTAGFDWLAARIGDTQ